MLFLGQPMVVVQEFSVRRDHVGLALAADAAAARGSESRSSLARASAAATRLAEILKTDG